MWLNHGSAASEATLRNMLPTDRDHFLALPAPEKMALVYSHIEQPRFTG